MNHLDRLEILALREPLLVCIAAHRQSVGVLGCNCDDFTDFLLNTGCQLKLLADSLAK
jgi:hypothetical protein